MANYADAETFFVGWLKAVGGYVNVTTEVPANLMDLIRTGPVIVVERVGGNDSTITLDVARMDVETYANSRDGAKLHAGTIRRLVRTQLPGYRTGGTCVGRVGTISAPIHVPYDSRTAVRRFVATYQLHLHQYVGV